MFSANSFTYLHYESFRAILNKGRASFFDGLPMPTETMPKEASTQLETVREAEPKEPENSDVEVKEAREDFHVTYTYHSKGRESRRELLIPLRQEVKDWKTDSVKPFEVSVEELEAIGVKHIWNDRQDAGGFGEKLAKLTLTKLYDWKEAKEPVANLIRRRGGPYEKGEEPPDILMWDKDNTLHLIEVKTFASRSKGSHVHWDDAFLFLKRREQTAHELLPSMKFEKDLFVINLRGKKKAISHQKTGDLLREGVNIIEMAHRGGFRKPKYMQVLELSQQGLLDEKIAEELGINRGMVRHYRSVAMNRERRLKYHREYQRKYRHRKKI